MGKLINRIPGSRLLISSLDWPVTKFFDADSFLELMF